MGRRPRPQHPRAAVGYGLTPPDVDVKIDSFMRSQYITAVRA